MMIILTLLISMAIYQSFSDTELVAMRKKGNELNVIPALEKVPIQSGKVTAKEDMNTKC